MTTPITERLKSKGFERFIKVCQLPSDVQEIVLNLGNTNPRSKSKMGPRWFDLSLVDGHGAFVLFYAVLDKMGDFGKEFDLVAHRYILEIKNKIEKEGGCSDSSLFSGTAGLCYALSFASKNRTRYGKMLEVLEEQLFHQLEEIYIPRIEANLKKGIPTHFKLYDVISGFTGIGLYLIKNNISERANQFISKLLRLCVDLTDPINYRDHLVPGWICPPEFYPQKETQKNHPFGILNMGLSHGIPSVLGFMAIALKAGIEVPRQKEAMNKIIGWLLEKVSEHKGCYFFRSQTTFDEQISSFPPKASTPHNREAWCYGTPGVARTLYLAGKALGDEKVVAFSEKVFLSIFERSYEDWNLAGPTFCHGLAGTLLIASLMAKDTKNQFLYSKVEEMKKRLLNFYSENHSFGFCDFDLCEDMTYYPVDKASLLTGATGVWLTWLSIESDKTPDWYYPFMVSYA